jgi:imidazolonepropionase-like amidohydrolase
LAVWLVLSLGLVWAAAPEDVPLAIIEGMLIDGNGGPPMHDAVVLVQGEKIVAAGPRGTVQIPSNAKVISAGGMTVMPGLFDFHVHLLLMGHGKYDDYFPKYRERLRREIMPASARELLLHGVTSARDMGANLEDIIEVRERINREEIPGPRLFICGPILQKTLAGGDMYNLSAQALFRWTIDSPEDARAKVKKLLDAGVDFIKLIQGEELAPKELAVVVEEAHKTGKIVAAHGLSESEIRTMVQAGVDTLEHTGLGPGALPYAEDIIKLLIDKQTVVVPTGIVAWTYKLTQEFPERRFNQEVRRDFPPDLVQDLEQSLGNFTGLQYFTWAPGWIASGPRRWRQLINSGVRVVIGTDSGTPINFHTESTWREMQLMAQHGMTPLQVISAATKWPAIVMKQGANLGTIEAGKLADVIIVKGNVLENLNNLRNVAHVIKGGKVYK